MEDMVGSEPLRHVGFARGGAMHARDVPRHFRRDRRIDDAVAKLRLPHRVLFGRQVFHRECPALRIVAQDARHEFGNDRGRGAHPRHLPAIALHGRLPIGAYFEPWERPLDADGSARQIDAIDVGRDAARERHERRVVIAADEAHAMQRRVERRGELVGRVRHPRIIDGAAPGCLW